MHNIYFVSYLAGSALLVYEPRYELGIFSSGTIPMDGAVHLIFFRPPFSTFQFLSISTICFRAFLLQAAR
jgi:hypothetical protein